MMGHVKRMQEALDWLERNPNSRIATEAGSPFEEDGGASFVRGLYTLGAASVEVDANDGDEVASYLHIILNSDEDWVRQVRVIMELGKTDPVAVEALDRRTIKLTLCDATVKDSLVCIKRKIRELDDPFVQAAVARHWTPNMNELWSLFLEFRRNADKAAGIQDEYIEIPTDPEDALKLINRPYRCIEYAAERWLRDNYPREHSRLFGCTGASFFRPIKEFKA